MRPLKTGQRLISLAAVSFAIAGCTEQPKIYSQSEIEDIASDAAADAVSDTSDGVDTSELSGQIDDLELKVSNLEAQNAELRSELASVAADTASLRAEFGRYELAPAERLPWLIGPYQQRGECNEGRIEGALHA